MEEDYDMVPHNEILKLKKEVEDLKSGTGSEIRKAMHELTDSINKMNEILKETAEGMKTEESEEFRLDKRIGLLIDKLDIILEENKKIAESMVSFAELIKERFPVQRTAQIPLPRTVPRPAMPPTRPVPPPPMPAKQMPPPPMPAKQMPPPPMPARQMPPPPMSQERGLPPIPPRVGRKKRIFG